MAQRREVRTENERLAAEWNARLKREGLGVLKGKQVFRKPPHQDRRPRSK